MTHRAEAGMVSVQRSPMLSYGVLPEGTRRGSVLYAAGLRLLECCRLGPHRTPCATPSRPTCSRTGTTSAPFKSSSGTGMSAPHRSTRTCSTGGRRECEAPRTGSSMREAPVPCCVCRDRPTGYTATWRCRTPQPRGPGSGLQVTGRTGRYASGADVLIRDRQRHPAAFAALHSSAYSETEL